MRAAQRGRRRKKEREQEEARRELRAHAERERGNSLPFLKVEVGWNAKRRLVQDRVLLKEFPFNLLHASRFREGFSIVIGKILFI